MQTTLTAIPGRHDHPPQTIRVEARRVGLIDRLALHVGIALVAWGRRPLAIESRERRANRVEQELARRERERVTERSVLLMLPPR